MRVKDECSHLSPSFITFAEFGSGYAGLGFIRNTNVEIHRSPRKFQEEKPRISLMARMKSVSFSKSVKIGVSSVATYILPHPCDPRHPRFIPWFFG
jgi:hypothetical protein